MPTQDELLDEILGEEEPVEDPPEEAGAESPADSEEASAPDDEPAVEAGAQDEQTEDDDEDEEPAPLAASEEPAEAEAEGESDTPDDPVEAEKRRADGLQRTVAELRKKLNEERLKAMQQPQGAPQAAAPQATEVPVQATQQGQPGAAPEIPGVPVTVSPDGQQVYVPREELEKLVRATSGQVVDERMAPTPEQQAITEHHQMLQQYVGEDPARSEQRTAVVQRVQAAEEFMRLKSAQLESQGYRPSTKEEAIELLHMTGVDEEMGQFVPELAPMFDEFVQAWASGQPGWKRSILERVEAAASGKAMPGGEPGPALRSVEGGPQSLAKKGGARNMSTTKPDEAEFATLEKKFDSAPWEMSDKEWSRLQGLGRKLGKPGFDEAGL